ncbi:iron ABC transporter permease [Lutibacter sp. B2]|nr:iron ABC transporter permease [Lutibacter sp. B2]
MKKIVAEKANEDGKNLVGTTKILISLLIFCIIFILSLMVGRYRLTPVQILYLIKEIPKYIWGHNAVTPPELIFYRVRLPRAILASTVGAVLSITGVLFQGIFKNPLASPSILGVTSGCCFGAALGILLPTQYPYIVQILAFVFGIISVLLTYSMAKIGKNQGVIMLVLAGMVISSFFSAALSFLKYVADPYEQLPAIVFWMMGGFHRSNWTNVSILLISVIPCVILLISMSWQVNIISLGDEDAKSLGINVKKIRFILLIIASFMVASCVSVSGTISWVALVIPHITRLIIGSNHRYTLPLSFIIGGSFTLVIDNIARTLTTSEIPISILTAAVGAPVFGYLLLMKKENLW